MVDVGHVLVCVFVGDHFSLFVEVHFLVDLCVAEQRGQTVPDRLLLLPGLLQFYGSLQLAPSLVHCTDVVFFVVQRLGQLKIRELRYGV